MFNNVHIIPPSSEVHEHKDGLQLQLRTLPLHRNKLHTLENLVTYGAKEE